MHALLEQILTRLGFSTRPDPTPDGLASLYAAWCQHVPFDNVRKLIHLRAEDKSPLPGSRPEDFFEAWLRHGTGGTCWAGAGAIFALLRELGFDADRGIATMLVVPNLPPNHAAISVRFDSERHLVDCSMLHGKPLRLDPDADTRIEHPAWGVSYSKRDDLWHVHWRPLHKPEGIDCRFERFGVGAGEYPDFHQRTRAWSPFNYEIHARLNHGDEVIGVAFGHSVTFQADGSVTRAPAANEERRRRLIEDFGMSEEIVSCLPRDRPTPPPPGSFTAQQQDL